jgi:hypothetical protein
VPGTAARFACTDLRLSLSLLLGTCIGVFATLYTHAAPRHAHSAGAGASLMTAAAMLQQSAAPPPPPRRDEATGLSIDAVVHVSLVNITIWEDNLEAYLWYFSNDASGLTTVLSSVWVVLDAAPDEAAAARASTAVFVQVMRERGVDAHVVVRTGVEQEACCGLPEVWALAARGNDSGEPSQRVLLYVNGGPADKFREGNLNAVVPKWRRVLHVFSNDSEAAPRVDVATYGASAAGVPYLPLWFARQSRLQQCYPPPAGVYESASQWLVKVRRKAGGGGGGGGGGDGAVIDECPGDQLKGQCFTPAGGIIDGADAKADPPCTGAVTGCIAGSSGMWSLCKDDVERGTIWYDGCAAKFLYPIDAAKPS